MGSKTRKTDHFVKNVPIILKKFYTKNPKDKCIEAKHDPENPTSSTLMNSIKNFHPEQFLSEKKKPNPNLFQIMYN